MPPQLSTGYSPARVGLGDRNVQIFRKLSSADQVAYNRALLGDDLSSTFAVALETEDLSRTGGCTRKALTETFKPDQLKASHYNPQDALINKDPRMKAALEFWQREMKKAGFEYGHPDEIEPDLRNRLSALTEGGKLLVSKMSADQKAALRKLQDFERLVAAKSFKMSGGHAEAGRGEDPGGAVFPESAIDQLGCALPYFPRSATMSNLLSWQRIA